MTIRKTLYLLVALVLTAILIAPLPAGRGGAGVAMASGEGAIPAALPLESTQARLPDFDIRHKSRESDQPFDVQSVAREDAVVASRLRAIEGLRAALAPDPRDSLRFEINEAKVPKVLFNYNAALSSPSADSPDNVARDFLEKNSDVFGLSRSEVRKLKLEGEDSDAGTSFLSYEQQIGGVNVFHGHVQVAVSSNGEVLSVNQGWLIPGYSVKTKPKLAEIDAIRLAFQYAGKDAPDSVLLIDGRESRGGRAVYANPLGSGFDNVLSDLRVMEVDERARLVWHFHVDVGAAEWYEMCLDAKTGELLFRHNLYADAAQGTVFTQNPTAGGRQLVSFVGDTAINTAAGWLGTSTVTTGNNVDAYLDTDANNVPDPNNSTGLSNGILIEAADAGRASLVEAGVDDVRILSQ